MCVFSVTAEKECLNFFFLKVPRGEEREGGTKNSHIHRPTCISKDSFFLCVCSLEAGAVGLELGGGGGERGEEFINGTEMN